MNTNSFNERKFTTGDADQVDKIKQDLDSSINSKDILLEKTKRELLDTFLDSKNSVHIDNKAQDIKIQRENQATSDIKVNVISGIDSAITFKGKSLLRKDHEEIYNKYNEILKDENINEVEKNNQLEKLDRLIASEAALMTENKSIMYKFKRRVYFSTQEHRDEVFSSLDSIEPFKGKIKKYQGEFSGETHYIIRWENEITKNNDPKVKDNKEKNEKKEDTKENSSDKNSINSKSNSGSIINIDNSIDMQPMADAIIKMADVISQNNSQNQTINMPQGGQYLQQQYPLFYGLVANNGVFPQNINQQNPTINNTINGGGDKSSENTQLIIVIEKMLENLELKLENKFDQKYNKFVRKISKIKNLGIEEIKQLMEIELKKVELNISENMDKKLDDIKQVFIDKIDKLEKKYDSKLNDIRDYFNKHFEDLKLGLLFIKNQIDDLKKELIVIKEKQEILGENMDELKGKQEEVNNKIDELNKKIEEISQQMKDIQEKLDECCDEEKQNIIDDGEKEKIDDEEEKEGTQIIHPIGRLDESLDVNFSDMSQSIKDIADERTYNENSKNYVEQMQNKSTRFGRMLVGVKHAMLGDIFRLRKYKRERKDIDNSKNRLNVTGDWSNIAKVHGGQALDPVMELTETEYPIVYKRISDLSYNYYKGGAAMSDTEFERELNKIFSSRDAENLVDTLNANGVSIEKSASDILQSLKIQKAQNELTYQVSKAVNQTLSSTNPLDAAAISTLENNLTNQFKQFTRDNKLVPQLFSHFNKLNPTNTVNLNNSYEDISKHLVAHLDSLTMIAAQSMTNKVKLNIKFLADGHAVDHIDVKNSEKQKRWNPVSKIGNIMYGQGYRWRRIPTKVLVTGGTAALGTALFGPLGGIVAGSLAAGSLAAGKKSAQIQRKKYSIEKEYIKDRNNKTDIMNQKDLMKMKYLEDIGNYEEIIAGMDAILSSSNMSNDDKTNLVGFLSRIVAGLDYQKESGHNAFSIDKKVKVTRPEDKEIKQEQNYNEAMSQLYKYKELGIKRLQLEDENITEEDIRGDSQYDGYTKGYRGDFKAFLKLFKKERIKESRKTGAKTAAIYATIGGITAGISHFLDTYGGSGDTGIISIPSDVEVPIGDAQELYDLGVYKADALFNTNLGSEISKIPSGVQDIKIDYFSGVDGTPANPLSFSMTQVDAKVAEIQKILTSGSFSPSTVASAQSELTSTNISDMIDFAKTSGADAGNQHLFVLRNLEGIKSVLEQTNSKTDLNIDFDFDSSHSTIGAIPKVPADRLTGIDINQIEHNETIIDGGGGTGPNVDLSAGAGQGLYTENNTHKGEEKI